MFHEISASLASAETSLNNMKTRLLAVLLRRRINRDPTESKSRVMMKINLFINESNLKKLLWIFW